MKWPSINWRVVIKWLSIGLVSLVALGAALWLTRGRGIDGTLVYEYETELFPQGRDAAIVKLLTSSKKSVLVKTERFEMLEVASVLANLARDGVPVTVELPLAAASRHTDLALARILMDCGAVCRIGMDSHEGYRGTLVVADGRTLYSACPLTYTATANSVRPYVMGRVKYGSI